MSEKCILSQDVKKPRPKSTVNWRKTLLVKTDETQLPTHCFLKESTVDSRYLELQGTLWNTSRYPYFDISDLRNWGKQLIEQPPLTEWTCNLTPKLEIYWKYCGKEEKLLLRSNFSSFPQYFYCLLVDLCIKTGTRFSLRDKRLFEISEFEITRVDCISFLRILLMFCGFTDKTRFYFLYFQLSPVYFIKKVKLPILEN